MFTAGKVYFQLLIFLKVKALKFQLMTMPLDLGPTPPQTKERNYFYFLIPVRFHETSVDTPKPGLSFYIRTNGPSFTQNHKPICSGTKHRS